MVFLVVKLALLLAGLVAVIVFGRNPSDLVHDMQYEGGMTYTEILALYLGFTPNAASMVFFGIVFRKMRKGLADFCKQFAEFDGFCISDEKLEQIYRNNKYSVMRTNFFSLICSIVMGVSFWPFQGAKLEQPNSVLITVFWAIMLWVAIYPVVRSVCHAIICQCLQSLVEMFEEFERQWKKRSKKCDLICQAVKLDNILRSLNDALSYGIVVDFTLSLWMLIFSLFFGIMTFTSFSGGFKHLVCFYGISSTIWSVVIVVKVSKIVGMGQRLTTSMKNIKLLLQGFYVENNIDQANQLHQLIEKFGSRSSALRPFDAFDVSYSNALSISGWLITNIIILMQFRVAESA